MTEQRYDFEVKEYKSPQAYRKDAKKMAKKGWVVTSAEEYNEHSGCLRIGCIAVIFLPLLIFLRKKPKIVVTYRRVRR
jgi:hypothetical protein